MFFHRRIHPALMHREFQIVPLEKSLEDTAKKTIYIRDLSRILGEIQLPKHVIHKWTGTDSMEDILHPHTTTRTN
ncbi:hypothetical protein Gorai_021397 [Gossypium raimondii]|uniref:Uncharacterized protein n=1 Tax=Gossypium raimondii TaxID=29730 RepID=A0A7J8NQG8_GOSRA|nr:hypothetical protein [Gossypium raimondii]